MGIGYTYYIRICKLQFHAQLLDRYKLHATLPDCIGYLVENQLTWWIVQQFNLKQIDEKRNYFKMTV